MKYAAQTQIIDPNFQTQHSGKCDLLIKISGARFSYAVVDQAQDQLKALGDIATENTIESLDGLLEIEHFFGFDFHRVKIATETSKFTFIPATMYSESNLPEYALFLKGHPSELTVSDIRLPQIKNVAGFDAKIQESLSTKFSSYKMFGSANPLIEGTMKIYAGTAPRLVLNFGYNVFEAVVLQYNKLSFYNLFPIDNTDDFNYFLLLILKEFGLQPQDLSLIVSGNINEGDEILGRLQKYFSEIKYAEAKFLVQIPEMFQTVPSHRFFDLISLNLCE